MADIVQKFQDEQNKSIVSKLGDLGVSLGQSFVKKMRTTTAATRAAGNGMFVEVDSEIDGSSALLDTLRDESAEFLDDGNDDPMAHVRASDLRKHIPQNRNRDIIDRNVTLVQKISDKNSTIRCKLRDLEGQGDQFMGTII